MKGGDEGSGRGLQGGWGNCSAGCGGSCRGDGARGESGASMAPLWQLNSFEWSLKSTSDTVVKFLACCTFVMLPDVMRHGLQKQLYEAWIPQLYVLVFNVHFALLSCHLPHQQPTSDARPDSPNVPVTFAVLLL